jgi:DNA (cytosine-5)-methyltransferase 1
MTAYYNEIDPYAAQWLRNLIDAGHIAPGDVDERSINDVRPDDLRGYTQLHFFAGIGGWPAALRLASWPDDRPVWTGSCPCQPFSAQGQRGGFADPRHLWPAWLKLIAERRPSVIFGEQSAQAVDWLRLVRGDLEALEYAVGAVPIEAASAGADVLGDRFWFVAAADLTELRRQSSAGQQSQPQQNTGSRPRYARRNESWRCGADGKKRRVNTSIDWLAHGVSRRMAKLRGFGNAIDPRLGAAFIGAAMTVSDTSQLGNSK